MKLTDGKRTVKITMHTWDGTNKSPDFSQDFFATSNLPYDAENDTYIVQDVEYCIEQAEDWENRTGDFREDEDNIDTLERLAFID